MVKSIKKQTLPTKNKPKREEGAGIFEQENLFLFPFFFIYKISELLSGKIQNGIHFNEGRGLFLLAFFVLWE